MTIESISSDNRRTSNERWRPIFADLAFWSVAGATVAVLSEPLGGWWSVPPMGLLAGGVAFVVVGAGLWLVLHRIRPTPRGLVCSFGVSNLALALIAWTVAAFHLLPVSAAGDWALACTGDIALVLGAWQLNTLRRT